MELRNDDRPRIVVVTDHYLPGWKAGGPIRSLSNLIAELSNDFDFRLVTRDRDRDDTEPYADVLLDTWVPVGRASVFYGRPGTLSPRHLYGIISAAEPQLVYLNSMYSRLTIGYLSVRRLRRRSPPVVINPRGELDPRAMSIKSVRKKFYLTAARLLGLFSDVAWQASTATESGQIASRIGGAVAEVATNLPLLPPLEPYPVPQKTPGSAHFVFISRVGPMKNLTFLLEALSKVRGRVELGIYGRKLAADWARVERLLDELPEHLTVTYRGIPRHEEVDGILRSAHFFALPTLAESFGHSIYEALSAGRPVVISDRTPWRRLMDGHAGWDLPLEDLEVWVDALQQCVDMDHGAYESMSRAAHEKAQLWYDAEDRHAAHAEVFRVALAARR